MVGFWRYTSTHLRIRMERPWLIVGPRGRPSNGLMWRSRIVRARSVHATCTFATTAIIISGRCRGRRRWSTAWCAVRSPRARVGGAPSAPKPNCPSVCRAGVWAGTCFAGSVIVVVLAIGRCLSFVWSYRTRTRSGCQTMLAARQQDPAQLWEVYQDIESLVLTIDGLQPDKGHETLYVVRELMRKRVWFAEPLLSSAEQEVHRVLVQARQWAERVPKPVRAWMSDKQDAFVKAIASEFPGIPHRYCHNHFMRDLAKPVLDLDSQAKVTMRSKVRGLRAIERRVLEERRQAAASASPPPPGPPQDAATSPAALPASVPPATVAPPEPCASSAGGLLQTESALEATRVATPEEAAVEAEAGEIVLGYCAAVRGILNDSQGGPLHPPGLRMSEALQEVRDALERNLGAQ